MPSYLPIAKILLPNFWQRLEQQQPHLNSRTQVKVDRQSNITLAIPAVAEDRVIFFSDSID